MNAQPQGGKESTFEETMGLLIQGAHPNPDGGPPLKVDCRSVVLASSLAGREAQLVAEIEMGPRLAVVCDENTRQALGERLLSSLSGPFAVTEIRLPGRPHPDEETVELVRGASAQADGLVAVGSGTINDICKYASHLDGKPYAVFATAPSMNGYTSANAAITMHGHKMSLAAHTARGVFMDLQVLASAPPRMIQSGLGDSVCRAAAQVDWLLSHLLLGTEYLSAPFVLLLPYEDGLFRSAAKLVSGDIEAMRLLCQTLTLSGFGMSIAGSSHPASEGEHLISHYLEMVGRDLPESFHGEQIAVTTLTMAALQEEMLGLPSLNLLGVEPDEAELKAHFGDELGASCYAEFAKKRLDRAGREKLQKKLDAEWPAIKSRLVASFRSHAEIKAALTDAGCPMRPSELGVPDDLYRDAVLHCREIRNRYTFLDLAAACGRLQGFVQRLEETQ